MKYPIFILLFTVFAFGCSEDDVKEALEQNQTVTVDQRINIDLSETDPKEIDESETFEASLLGFTLTNVQIQSLTFDVTGYIGQAAVGDVSLEGATLEFVGTGVSVDISKINLADAVSAPAIDLTSVLDAAALTAIQNKILAEEEITVNLSASVDKVPANFEVTLTFVLNLTARP